MSQLPVRIAKKIAKTSECAQKHGAVVMSGGSILGRGKNEKRYCRFSDRFSSWPARSRHAEVSAIYNIDCEGADVYVVRVDNDGQLKMSKPCPVCQEVMKFVGIKRVYYSTDQGTMEMMKIC